MVPQRKRKRSETSRNSSFHLSSTPTSNRTNFSAKLRETFHDEPSQHGRGEEEEEDDGFFPEISRLTSASKPNKPIKKGHEEDEGDYFYEDQGPDYDYDYDDDEFEDGPPIRQEQEQEHKSDHLFPPAEENVDDDDSLLSMVNPTKLKKTQDDDFLIYEDSHSSGFTSGSSTKSKSKSKSQSKSKTPGRFVEEDDIEEEDDYYPAPEEARDESDSSFFYNATDPFFSSSGKEDNDLIVGRAANDEIEQIRNKIQYKAKALARLRKLEMRGHKPSKKFANKDSLEAILTEVEVAESLQSADKKIKICRAGLYQITKLADQGSTKLHKSDIIKGRMISMFVPHLEGWSELTYQEIQHKEQYDDVLEKVYDKYLQGLVERDPLLELLWMLGSSAAMYHGSQIMAEKIRNDPKAVQEMVNNMINQVMKERGFQVQAQDQQQQQQQSHFQTQNTNFDFSGIPDLTPPSSPQYSTVVPTTTQPKLQTQPQTIPTSDPRGEPMHLNFNSPEIQTQKQQFIEDDHLGQWTRNPAETREKKPGSRKIQFTL